MTLLGTERPHYGEPSLLHAMNYPTQTAEAAMDGVSKDRLTPAPWLVPSQKSPSKSQRKIVLAAFSSRPQTQLQEQRCVRSDSSFLTIAPQR